MATTPATLQAFNPRPRPKLGDRQRSLRRGVGLLLVLSAVYTAGAAEGQEHLRDQDWSLTGSARLGAVATWTTSNLDPQYRPATRDPSTETEFDDGLDMYALIDLRLHAPNGASLYVRTPMEEYGVATGVTVPSTWGELDLQACYVFPDKVWEDPYLLGLPREETDRERFGGSVALNNIGGTRWSASYTMRHIDLEQDRAGQASPDLQRSGLTHQLEVSARLSLGGGQLLGSAGYERADLDGDAAAYDAATASVTYALPWRQFQFMLGIEIGYNWHRASHPLFRSTREDLRLGASAIAIHRDPFGITGAELGALSAWTYEESNCDFYDAQSIHLGIFIGYHF